MSMSAMPLFGDVARSMGGSLPPNVGIGFGPAPIDGGQNPVADKTQQQIANPIYGQNSPFQPPMPNPNVGIGFGPAPIDGGMGGAMGGKGGFFGGGNMPLQGTLPGSNIPYTIGDEPIPPISGARNIGQIAGGPAGRPIVGPGQQMPLPMMQDGGSVGQQQMPLPMMYNFAGGGDTGNNAPIQTGRPLQGKLPGSNIPYAIGNDPIPPVSGARNIGQIAGGPAGRPIMGGGLKPQPRNYRAPQRGGNLRSFIGR